jgi:hypothetical protein
MVSSINENSSAFINHGPIFSVPQPGQYLMVIGTYLLEIREGGHAEIHPVSSTNSNIVL